MEIICVRCQNGQVASQSIPSLHMSYTAQLCTNVAFYARLCAVVYCRCAVHPSNSMSTPVCNAQHTLTPDRVSHQNQSSSSSTMAERCMLTHIHRFVGQGGKRQAAVLAGNAVRFSRWQHRQQQKKQPQHQQHHFPDAHSKSQKLHLTRYTM